MKTIRIALAGLFALGTLAVAQPANAASLSCGPAALDNFNGQDYVVHSCSGSGTVRYTVKCTPGTDAIFSKKWTAPGGSQLFPFSCGWGAIIGPVSYEVIG